MKLYIFPASPNCRKVLATARHAGVELQIEIVDILAGEHQKPEFVAINPNRKVPALVDGDTTLWESNAIMGYVAAKEDTALWPRDDRRYDILRWQSWQLAHFGPACDAVAFETVFKKLAKLGDPDQGKIEAGLQQFRRYCAVLDAQLQGRSWLVGDELTLADFTVAAPLTYAEPAGLPLREFKHAAAWHTRLSEIPAWRDTMPRLP